MMKRKHGSLLVQHVPDLCIGTLVKVATGDEERFTVYVGVPGSQTPWPWILFVKITNRIERVR
jgi:hypothetical protein